MTCFLCERPVEKNHGYQLVSGWVALDRRDSLTLRQNVDPPKYACRSCIRSLQLGINKEQGVLA